MIGGQKRLDHSRREAKRHLPSAAKAKKMMKEGMANGHMMTKKQMGLMGMIAGGKKPKGY